MKLWGKIGIRREKMKEKGRKRKFEAVRRTEREEIKEKGEGRDEESRRRERKLDEGKMCV